MAILLILLLGAPALAVIASLSPDARIRAEPANLAASAVSFAAAIGLAIAAPAGGATFTFGYLLVDPLGAWVVLCAAAVYLLASIYARGYMRLLDDDARLPQFYALFAGFALTIFLAPLMNDPGLYWIAIELTTLVSTFLVAFERAPEAVEAGWKYIIVVSAGITLALLGTVLFYWNGSLVLGPTYRMSWAVLRQAAPGMNHPLLLLAFLLVLVGYGTKVGLAPMHSWLPDAHSEGPSPVSAMLSGALLNAAMVGIVRFLAVLHRAGMVALPDSLLMAFGVISLFVAAFFIIRQSGVKRLMAYSSVEHMGVIALGFGFGGPFGVAGAMYHMLNHSLAKSLMFFGAGNAMRRYGSKTMSRLGGFTRDHPMAAGIWLAGAVAITGAPPFGLFASEIAVLHAGFDGIGLWAAVIMLVLLIVIFIGFLNHFRLMYFDADDHGQRSEATLSRWCVAPMGLALVPVLIFGLWWPRAFWTDFGHVAHDLVPAVSAPAAPQQARRPLTPGVVRPS